MTEGYIEVRSKLRRSAALRLGVVMTCFTLGFGAIGAKMFVISSVQPGEPRTAARSEESLVTRAQIVDRSGKILAMNMPTHALYATPHIMVDPARAARELSRIFPDLDESQTLKDFTGKRKFLWLRSTISPEQMQSIHDIGEPGLLFATRDMRIYPNGKLASHILGGVRYGEAGVSDAELIGVAGVEKDFNGWLSDPENAGQSLRLSIDLSVQAALEEVVGRGVETTHAKGASAIIMQADTGQVVALASFPDFDPHNRPRPLLKGEPSDSPIFNRAVQGVYELGSTFKVFAVAQAMELGLIGPDTLVSAKPLQVGRFRIRDLHNYGDVMTVTKVITKSSNVGTANIIKMVGAERQKDFLSRLGLMEPTTIELGEASTGRPIVPTRWPDITMMTVAYGHGLSTSPLHLATAYSTILNGGISVTPSIVRGREVTPGTRIISETTSRRMRKMLRETVTEGTASFANIDGYEVGGKTGTAEKTKRNGKGYDRDRVVATFAGAFPMNDPKYVLILSLDEAEDRSASIVRRTAGWTAVPIAGELITRVAPLLGLEPVIDLEAKTNRP